MTDNKLDFLQDLSAEESEELRHVLDEFRRSISAGGWMKDAKGEAKRRVTERKQAALRAEYDEEVANVEHVEGRLRLRDEYRKLGLKI